MRCPRVMTLLTSTLSRHHTSVTAVTHRAYYLTRERPSVVLGGVCQLASMATYWRESEMPLQGFPNIVRWIDALMRIPAWADPWPAKARTVSVTNQPSDTRTGSAARFA